MIDDANTVDDGAEIETEICIVGAGAAGIAIALQFLGASTSVLILEAGGQTADPVGQALYQGEVADAKLHAPAHTYRERRYGGTTTLWGGRCIPFDPIDFEARAYMPGSGWPFGLETLLPYYPLANAICEAGRYAYQAPDAFPGRGMRPIISGFPEGDFTTDGLERFSLPTDFGQRYRGKLEAAPNVRVLLNANCTEVLTDELGGAVTGVAVRTLAGKRMTVRARLVVLAVGGIETPRLLLNSRAKHAAGIGNRGDLVGRNYMCHIAGTLGTLRVNGGRERTWHGYEISDEGVYCRRRFCLSPARQREMGVGNFVARLHHPRIPDPAHLTGSLSAIYLARALIPYEYRTRLAEGMPATFGGWLRHVRNVALDPFATAGFPSGAGAEAKIRDPEISVDRGAAEGEHLQHRFPRRAGAEPGQPHYVAGRSRRARAAAGSRRLALHERRHPHRDGLPASARARGAKLRLRRADFRSRRSGGGDHARWRVRRPPHRHGAHGRFFGRWRGRCGLPGARCAQSVHRRQRGVSDVRSGEPDADDRRVGATACGSAEGAVGDERRGNLAAGGTNSASRMKS